MRKIEHKTINSIEFKLCSVCKQWKVLGDFYKCKPYWDGLYCACKKCQKQSQKKYNQNNSEKVKQSKKKWCINNVPQIAKWNKRRNEGRALFKRYFKQLGMFEGMRRCPENRKLLEVKCAYCGKWIVPTNAQTKKRLQAFNGTVFGEHRFYCSENCKQSCPIYNQNKYPKDFKKATSREVVPLLRQLVLKRDNYICQKCGATLETAQLHVHHEKSYTLNKIMANDPDNCITLCKECHRWVHSQDGCRYNDLKC